MNLPIHSTRTCPINLGAPNLRGDQEVSTYWHQMYGLGWKKPPDRLASFRAGGMFCASVSGVCFWAKTSAEVDWFSRFRNSRRHFCTNGMVRIPNKTTNCMFKITRKTYIHKGSQGKQLQWTCLCCLPILLFERLDFHNKFQCEQTVFLSGPRIVGSLGWKNIKQTDWNFIIIIIIINNKPSTINTMNHCNITALWICSLTRRTSYNLFLWQPSHGTNFLVDHPAVHPSPAVSPGPSPRYPQLMTVMLPGQRLNIHVVPSRSRSSHGERHSCWSWSFACPGACSETDDSKSAEFMTNVLNNLNSWNSAETCLTSFEYGYTVYGVFGCVWSFLPLGSNLTSHKSLVIPHVDRIKFIASPQTPTNNSDSDSDSDSDNNNNNNNNNNNSTKSVSAAKKNTQNRNSIPTWPGIGPKQMLWIWANYTNS